MPPPTLNSEEPNIGHVEVFQVDGVGISIIERH